MPNIFITKHHWIHFGITNEDPNSTTIKTHYDNLSDLLNEFGEYANRNNFEIKSVCPLTTGYHTTQVTGLVILMQKVYSVTVEGYKKIMVLRKRITELHDEIEEMKQFKKESFQYPIKEVPAEVKEVQKLLSGRFFVVGENEFRTREEAEEFLEVMRRLAKYKDIPEEMEKRKEQIKHIEEDIDMLADQYLE